MPILKNLTFTAVPARAHDPVAARRTKLVERLEEQPFLRPDHPALDRQGRRAPRETSASPALVVGLGLRSKELTNLNWADVYETGGRVRKVVHLKAAYTKGGKTRDMFVAGAPSRSGEVRRGKLRDERTGVTDCFVRQPEGRTHDAVLDGAVSKGSLFGSGRRRRVLAQRAAHPDHAAGRTRRRLKGYRADRGPYVNSDEGDVRRGQPNAARQDSSGRDLLSLH
jgi:integrase